METQSHFLSIQPWEKQILKNNPANISTSDQRCFNVVDQHWNNVDPTLFNVAQSWYNVSARRWNNVKTTLHNVGTTLIQRCFNLVSTLVKSYIESNWASDDCGLWDSWIHVKYMNSFYSAEWENFLLYNNHSTTNEI